MGLSGEERGPARGGTPLAQSELDKGRGGLSFLLSSPLSLLLLLGLGKVGDLLLLGGLLPLARLERAGRPPPPSFIYVGRGTLEHTS